MENYNTRISLSVGLVNTYNIFQLDAAVADAIKIEVITDGGQYVEDDASTVMHAGTSNWRDFEGIKDISTNTWSLGYGSAFSQMLKNYLKEYEGSLTGTGLEIYESANAYQEYKNQFNVLFKSDVSLTNLKGQYFNYKKEPENLEGHHSIKGLTYGNTKGDTSSHYIYLNADIIHFSKYYPVYKISDMQVPVLQPVLYTKEDLSNLNLFINSQGIVCVNSLDAWHAFNDADGSNREHNNNVRYDAQTDGSFIANWDQPSALMDYTAGIEWDYSQYKQGSAGTHFRTDLDEVSEELYDKYYPRGFSIFGLNAECGTGINNSNGGDDGSKYRGSVAPTWRSTFTSQSYNYNLSSYGYIGSNQATVLCGLLYRGDSEDNVHLLNCWFTLEASGSGQHHRITQKARFKSGINKPKYVGMWIASVLCNMYHYVEDSSSGLPVLTDMVYLSEHYTTYTKDIIYHASTTMSNELLVFNGFNFRQYIALVKNAAGNVGTYDSSDNNITATIQACIKNVPLQYRIRYQQPNTDAINGGDGMFLLRTIDSPKPIALHGNSKLQPNRLYQVKNNNGEYEVDYLRSDFQIRYVKSLLLDPGEQTISGTYEENMEPDTYNQIDEVWSISENLYLTRNKYKIPVQDHYSIVSYEDEYKIVYKDFEKNEVLVPFAKFVQ